MKEGSEIEYNLAKDLKSRDGDSKTFSQLVLKNLGRDEIQIQLEVREKELDSNVLLFAPIALAIHI